MLKELGLSLEGQEELVDFSRSMVRLDIHFITLFLLGNVSVIQKHMSNKFNSHLLGYAF